MLPAQEPCRRTEALRGPARAMQAAAAGAASQQDTVQQEQFTAAAAEGATSSAEQPQPSQQAAGRPASQPEQQLGNQMRDARLGTAAAAAAAAADISPHIADSALTAQEPEQLAKAAGFQPVQRRKGRAAGRGRSHPAGQPLSSSSAAEALSTVQPPDAVRPAEGIAPVQPQQPASASMLRGNRVRPQPAGSMAGVSMAAVVPDRLPSAVQAGSSGSSQQGQPGPSAPRSALGEPAEPLSVSQSSLTEQQPAASAPDAAQVRPSPTCRCVSKSLLPWCTDSSCMYRPLQAAAAVQCAWTRCLSQPWPSFRCVPCTDMPAETTLEQVLSPCWGAVWASLRLCGLCSPHQQAAACAVPTLSRRVNCSGAHIQNVTAMPSCDTDNGGMQCSCSCMTQHHLRFNQQSALFISCESRPGLATADARPAKAPLTALSSGQRQVGAHLSAAGKLV